MYRIAYLVLISFIIGACSKKKEVVDLPYYNEPDFTPLFISDRSQVAATVPHTIGDFSLLDQDSMRFSQQDIEGKIHVANFIFTSCISICPDMTRNMKIVNEALNDSDEVLLLSYTVTPWIDTPQVLKRYKSNHDINNKNWHFLTGSQAGIYSLARQSYFAEEDIGFSRDSSEFLHTEHFVLVDKTKRIRGVYNGTLSLEMKQMIEDIESLQREE